MAALAAAWDVVDIGIVLLDDELKVSAVNQSLMAMANPSPALLGSRPAFRDLVDQAVADDLYDMPPESLPVFLKALDKELRLGSGKRRRIKLKDGRRLVFRCAVLPGGGRILTYVDITPELRQEAAEVMERTFAEGRFNSETMETQASYLATLAEDVAESAQRSEISRQLLEREIDERRQIETKLRILATIDGLTGALNRSETMATARRAFQDAVQFDRDLTLVMVDVDFFKSVNDHYGHAGGNHALRHLAGTLRDGIRESDFIGRLGGEEFLIGLLDMPPVAAVAFVDRLRRRIADRKLPFGQHMIELTVSMGAASLRSTDTSVEPVIIRADAALYRAKTGGRNRVELAAQTEAA